MRKQTGFSLVELMVAMAISLVVVGAAVYAYLASREGQRSVERLSGSRETGSFVLQILGRDLMNAGFYPANVLPITSDITQTGMYDGYYPLQGATRIATDWENIAAAWPPVAFQTGVFGCDGAVFDVAGNSCPSADNAKPDTLIINYFSGDAVNGPGLRRDCTGADSGNHFSNSERKKNTGGTPPATAHTAVDNNLAPQQPLFVSNRYTLSDTKIFVDNADLNTKSLACNGNGQSSAIYQPIVAGLEDFQVTYGIYTTFDPNSNNNSLAPTRFYTATEMNNAGTVPSLNIRGQNLTSWQRVTAVRVCVLTRTLGGNTRISDVAGSPSTYRDCSGVEKNQPSGYQMARYEQTFGVRNALRLSY